MSELRVFYGNLMTNAKAIRSHIRKKTSSLGTKKDMQPKQQWKHTEPAESVDHKRGTTGKKTQQNDSESAPC